MAAFKALQIAKYGGAFKLPCISMSSLVNSCTGNGSAGGESHWRKSTAASCGMVLPSESKRRPGSAGLFGFDSGCGGALTDFSAKHFGRLLSPNEQTLSGGSGGVKREASVAVKCTDDMDAATVRSLNSPVLAAAAVHGVGARKHKCLPHGAELWSAADILSAAAITIQKRHSSSSSTAAGGSGGGIETTGLKTGTIKGVGLAEEILKSRMQQQQQQAGGAQPPGGGSGGANKGEQQAKEKTAETDAEDKKRREAQWRAMKISFIVFGVSFGGIGVFLVSEWGSPKRDADGNIIPDEFSNLPLFMQYFRRTWKEIMFYNQVIREPSREKLLPDPLVEPLYQPPYTLVLEMTGVLVHPDWTYQTGWRFKKRPGVDLFLSQVGPPLFEVVIYTNELGFTGEPILNNLDPQGFIMYRLFRDSTRYIDGHHVKDLDSLNRDLSKVIVVDWNNSSVQTHRKDNVIHLHKWQGNDDDRTLFHLAMLLRTIATSGVDDVREVVRFYGQSDDPIEAFKENQRRLHEEQERLQQAMAQKEVSQQQSLTGSWAKGFGRRRLF